MSKMLTVVYDAENGMSTTDEAAMSRATSVVDLFNKFDIQHHTVIVGTELLILCFRLLVKRGEITASEIQFKFGDSIIDVTPAGKLAYQPPGFCDMKLKMLLELF